MRFVLCNSFALLLGGTALAADLKPGDLEFFEKRVRPVLVDNCYECHSTGKKARGGLLLDSREATLRGGDTGPSVVLGDPAKSLLIKAVKYVDDDVQMPPKHRLTPEQIAGLEEWVRRGAPDPRDEKTAPPSVSTIDFVAARAFWSFQPVRDPGRDKSIDGLVSAKLKEKGLAQVALADRGTLIRRVTFDLTGLPPTAEEVDAFVRDRAADAYPRLIERLLASPAYGERWGRHWLDVVRYADTAGDNSDYPIPQAYLYRDWVIEAFNRDIPYDQFLRMQLAGDLLETSSPEARRDNLIATGYIAQSRRFGVAPVMHLTMEDTLDNLGKGLLGLTIGCARCHDHKFDPISARDYYALYGIFASSRYSFAGAEKNNRPKDMVSLVTKDELERAQGPMAAELKVVDEAIEELLADKAAFKFESREVATKGGTAPEGKRWKYPSVKEYDNAVKAMNKRRFGLLDKIPETESAYGVSEGTPRNEKVQIRGEPDRLGEEVPRRFLEILGGQAVPADEKGSGRRQLAAWIADAKNPLTARVMVNRIWQHHFGEGLVRTPNDFGKQGRRPTHPELLDWLASRFVESGWSVKAMHRLMLTSRTYQLASTDRAKNLAVDPNDELLWKWNRRRLDAEEVRDSLLTVAGKLEPKPTGAHPFPAKNTWGFTQHHPYTGEYATRARSVYVMQQRIRRHSFFGLFDGADPNATTGARPQSTTALQALFAFNDPMVHEAAEGLAKRAKNDVVQAYRLALARKPSADELQLARAHVKKAGFASFARVLLVSNEFFHVE